MLPAARAASWEIPRSLDFVKSVSPNPCCPKGQSLFWLGIGGPRATGGIHDRHDSYLE